MEGWREGTIRDGWRSGCCRSHVTAYKTTATKWLQTYNSNLWQVLNINFLAKSVAAKAAMAAMVPTPLQ